MAGTVLGRLSLEEGDSANSLEGLDSKLGAEGKTTSGYLLHVWGGVALLQERGHVVSTTRPEVRSVNRCLNGNSAGNNVHVGMFCSLWICVRPVCVLQSSRAWWRWAKAHQEGSFYVMEKIWGSWGEQIFFADVHWFITIQSWTLRIVKRKRAKVILMKWSDKDLCSYRGVGGTTL